MKCALNKNYETCELWNDETGCGGCEHNEKSAIEVMLILKAEKDLLLAKKSEIDAELAEIVSKSNDLSMLHEGSDCKYRFDSDANAIRFSDRDSMSVLVSLRDLEPLYLFIKDMYK